MADTTKPTLRPPSTFVAARTPITDKSGMPTWSFMKILQDWDTKLQNGLSSIGQLIGEINAGTVVSGRKEGIGVTLGNIDDKGVMTPRGLAAATEREQGAVVLPAGATGNALGTAATQDAAAFDAAGSSATAQTAAETYAAAAAAAAQAGAEAFAANASNLSSGNVQLARLPAEGMTVDIATAPISVGGAKGSMTFRNGVLTAQTPAT